MRIKVLIQARLGSTRFPKKVMQKIDSDKTILEYLIDRLLLSGKLTRGDIVICTTDSVNDDELYDYAINILGISCFRGSEENVYLRFHNYLINHECDAFFRVCSDNPFISPSFLAALVDYAENTPGADYWSYCAGDIPAILTHYGFFAELVNYSAFIAAKEHIASLSKEYSEHVTPIFYRNSLEYQCCFLEMPDYLLNNPNVRFTVDTPEDLEHIKHILKRLAGFGQFDAREIMEIVLTDSQLIQSMNVQKLQNRK